MPDEARRGAATVERVAVAERDPPPCGGARRAEVGLERDLERHGTGCRRRFEADDRSGGGADGHVGGGEEAGGLWYERRRRIDDENRLVDAVLGVRVRDGRGRLSGAPDLLPVAEEDLPPRDRDAEPGRDRELDGERRRARGRIRGQRERDRLTLPALAEAQLGSGPPSGSMHLR